MATGCGGCGDCDSGVACGIGAGIGAGTAAGTSSLRATIGAFSRRTAGGIGEGFSRIGACEILACSLTGLGAVSAGGLTGGSGGTGALGTLASGAGVAGGLATGASDAGRTSAMLRVGGGTGRTAMYTIPEAIAAPATKAATIFQFMLNPLTKLNAARSVYVS